MASEQKFAYEWQKFSQILPEHEGQFKKWIAPLKPYDFRGKKVLDAGCGGGRNAWWCLIYGAKSVVAFDFDWHTVNVAKNNLAKFKNVQVVYKNIYDLAWKNSFDIVFSIGVIHHLENPERAIKSLVTAAKPGGQVLVWLYGREGNHYWLTVINLLRKVTTKLPLSTVNIITYLFSLPVFLWTHLAPQRHLYIQQLKTFSFSHIHAIIFDQLIPDIARYYSRDEALSLFRKTKLQNLVIHQVNGNSWTILGTKA